MSDESAARWVYEKACTLRNIGNYKDAVRILCEVSKSRYSPTYVSCVDLLIELYFRDIDAFTSRKVMAVMRDARKKISDAQQLEFETTNIVNILFKHLYKLCDDAYAQVSKITTNPSENAVILAAFAGVPLHTRVSEFFLTPCKQIVSGVAYELFTSSVLGTSRKVYAVYLDTALQFMEHCKKYAMTAALEKAADSMVKMITRAFLDPIADLSHDANLYDTKQLQDVEMELDRGHFYKSDTAVPRTVEVLSVLLRELAAAGRWRQVSSTLSCLIRLTRALEERDVGEAAAALRRTVQMAYDVMAETFWMCANYNHHAYCLIKPMDSSSVSSAGLMWDEERVHSAIMATLCCRDAMDEAAGGMYALMPNHVDAALHEGTLFEQVNTSRSALWAKLLRLLNRTHKSPGAANATLATRVDGTIGRFMSALYDADATDFADLHVQLSNISGRFAYLTPYDKPLRHILLRRQLKHLASRSNLVDTSALAMHGARLSRREYIHVMEPAILADEAVPVEINSKTGTLSFHNATRSNLLHAFRTLAESAGRFARVGPFAARHVNPTAAGECASTELPSVVGLATVEGDGWGSATTTTTPLLQPPVCARDVADAGERSRRVHRLQTLSIAKIHSRRQMKKDQEYQSKRDVLELRRSEEEERRLRAKERQIEQLRAEHAELERQERRRVMVRRLREKYKGIALGAIATTTTTTAAAAAAAKSTSSFEDELTQKLAAAKRAEAESKRRAMLCTNLVEGALRRLEIPKRKEQEEHNMEQRRAELADSRKNFLYQHQQEFERRQREKEVLRVFVEDVSTFEKKMLQASGIDKSSKRDEQESIIQQEMKRLEAQA